MNAPRRETVARNYVPLGPDLAAAVCQFCGRNSRPVETESDGQPSLWAMARGWSCAAFPAKHRHADGSIGSAYTCPGCNRRLRKGETLQLRSYLVKIATEPHHTPGSRVLVVIGLDGRTAPGVVRQTFSALDRDYRVSVDFPDGREWLVGAAPECVLPDAGAPS